MALDELLNTKSLLELTGRALKKRMAMWGGKRHRAPFQEQIPCKLQVINGHH